MDWLITGFVIGGILYLVGRFADLEARQKRMLKWAGLVSATLGAMAWVSVIYVNHTAWFYWPAIIFGAVAAGLGFFHSHLDLQFSETTTRNLRWLGSGLLVSGLFMAFVPAGASLFIGLLVLAGAVYLKLVKTGKAEQFISDIDRKLEKF